MSTHGDSRRSIVAWLEAEAADRAPSRLVEAARERVGATPQRTGWWAARRTPRMHPFAKLTVAATAVAIVSFGALGLMQRSGSVIDPVGSSPSPTPRPSVAAGGQWPEATGGEVHKAQVRADAGDPAYTWQVDPELFDLDHSYGNELATPAIVDRFLRNALGWEAFAYNVLESYPEGFPGSLGGLVYIRCAPGETNPLYPNDVSTPDAERCAPTIDGLGHESVRIHIDQPDQKGPDGVWVVSDWTMIAPFTQVDPRVAEAEVTARLEEWLAARIAGTGAERTVATEDDRGDGRCNRARPGATCTIDEVPLLYATTSGMPYERYEIERIGGPRWPYGEMEFTIRLFADEGATVVEQPILWIDRQLLDGDADLGLLSTVTEMTENGQPVAVPFLFFDGGVTASAARPWKVSHQYWNYGLNLDESEGGVERVAFVRAPRPVTGPGLCLPGPSPADAAELAEALTSDPRLEVTAPEEVMVGGARALQMDIVLAAGASVCGQEGVLGLVTGTLMRAEFGPDTRVRLYVVDLPAGAATRTMAIAVEAPGPRFEQVLEAAAPVLDSIEFQTP